jgi:hypothetical protein
MTEAELQAAVIEMAAWFGYRLVYHTHDSRRSAEGFPDLVIVGKGRVLFIELKSASGNLTPAQATWYAGLVEAGAEVFVWRPEDWKNGTIEKELKNVRSK